MIDWLEQVPSWTRFLRGHDFQFTVGDDLLVTELSSRLKARGICPRNAEETAMIDGTKLGVFVLLGILLVVQGAFAAFFLYLRKRYKENADIELDMEWLELQRGSR